MPVTRSVLNSTPCSTPGCTNCTHEMHLHAQCHPHAPLNIHYDRELGWLVIRCHKCKMLVCEVVVGEGK